MGQPIVYAKVFSDLQLWFAHQVSQVSGQPLPGILLQYTNLYIRFGLGRGFDPAHPIWQEYLAGLSDDFPQQCEWTYGFLQRRGHAAGAARLRDPVQVIGRSWLYNLPAYRRLFPREFTATWRMIRGGCHSMALWGQFPDRHGELRATMAHNFRVRVEQQASVEDLLGCFPFSVIAVEAPVLTFYDFYGVRTS